MDKATTSAILGTLLGLAAGIGGMIAFGPPRDDGRTEELDHKVASRDAELAKKDKELGDLRHELEGANIRAGAGEAFAEEQERLAKEKGEAEERANALKDELDKFKGSIAEDTRQKDARIERLEQILAEHGITEHLTDAEVSERISKFEGAFNTAFMGKDKRAAMQAMWDLQKLGPRAYDQTIELWRKMAEDFGVNPWAGGPGTLGMTEQDYVSLISEWALVEKGLTDPKVASDFRINAIYGTPWWANQDPAKRVKLLGDLLLTSSGYEAMAAIDSLGNINHPLSVRYLSDYLAQNRDNLNARKAAITELAGKNTTDAWAAIEDAATKDTEEAVRKHAQQQLESRDVDVAGIRITFVDENAQGALAGIKTGDILTHYNDVRVKGLGDVNKAKEAVGEGQSVKVVVRRGKEDVTLTLGPGMIGINGVSVAPKE